MVKRILVAGLISTVMLLFILVPFSLAETEPVEVLYVFPFDKGEAPEVVTSNLFDALIEHLYLYGEKRGMQVTIVKQELTDTDADWFAGKHYLVGDMAAYSVDKGCCYTEIKLTGRSQMHLPGGTRKPILELSDESFFNHDVTAPQQAQIELSSRLGKKMAEQLLNQIAAD